MKRLKLAVPVLLALTLAGEASACPGCKEAVADQRTPESAGLRDGYFWSILLMLSVPTGLLGTGGLMVARAVKRGALPEM